MLTAIGKNRSRGHLSRSACRHVKQGAKRSGLLTQFASSFEPSGAPPEKTKSYDESPKVPRPQDPAARDAARPWRLAALAVRGDVRGAVPHAGLSLRHDGAGRGALQGRRPGLHLFALRQSDGRDVRAAHGAAGRRGGGARDRERHGRGDRLADGPGQGRRSCRRGQGAVRLVPLCRRGAAAALRRRLDAGRWSRSRRLARGDAAQHQDRIPRVADQSDARDHRHRRRRGDRARSTARRWSSTMFSPRRCSSIR